MPTDLPNLLVCQSYQLSANRILEALNGTFSVSNSREPTKPPAPGNEIVGLCGQGGRHPFFRVGFAALKTTVEKILVLDCLRPDATEVLSTLCQSLRRQTVFDDQTGCKNDRVPEVVPLLPPEEIWYDGREMPLDVWRLISFEIDMVSTSISAQVPLDDIAFGSLSQAGLAFRAMMGALERKYIEFDLSVEVDPKTFKKISSPSVGRTRVPLSRLFFEAGCLLTPVRKNEVTQWYAALRYADWLASAGNRLAVRDEYDRDSVDSRYRGLFAEEMAIGLMAVVLGDGFRAKPIVNTIEYFDSRGLPEIPRNQPIADFIAEARHRQTRKKWTIIAESKGSLGKDVDNSRVQRAKTQASTTKLRFPRTSQKLPLAFCSSVYFENQGKEAICRVLDPPGELREEDQNVDPVSAWQIAYSKAFRFVGLDAASRQVLRGEPVSAIYTMSDERFVARDDRERPRRRLHRAGMARELFGSDLVLDVGDCAVAINSDIVNLLREVGVNSQSLEKLEEGSDALLERGQRAERSSFLNYMGIGCIFYEELEGERSPGKTR